MNTKRYSLYCMLLIMEILNSSPEVKVKSPFLTKHHAIKTYWGSGGIAPRIFDFGT
jgi:hypothetical protein